MHLMYLISDSFYCGKKCTDMQMQYGTENTACQQPRTLYRRRIHKSAKWVEAVESYTTDWSHRMYKIYLYWVLEKGSKKAWWKYRYRSKFAQMHGTLMERWGYISRQFSYALKFCKQLLVTSCYKYCYDHNGRAYEWLRSRALMKFQKYLAN